MPSPLPLKPWHTAQCASYSYLPTSTLCAAGPLCCACAIVAAPTAIAPTVNALTNLECIFSSRQMGRLGGPGMPLSPMLHGSIDLQARCSKQIAEDPLVPPLGGVQKSEALRQSDTLPKFFGISQYSLGEKIDAHFPSAISSNVLPPYAIIV